MLDCLSAGLLPCSAWTKNFQWIGRGTDGKERCVRPRVGRKLSTRLGGVILSGSPGTEFPSITQPTKVTTMSLSEAIRLAVSLPKRISQDSCSVCSPAGGFECFSARFTCSRIEQQAVLNDCQQNEKRATWLPPQSMESLKTEVAND